MLKLLSYTFFLLTMICLFSPILTGLFRKNIAIKKKKKLFKINKLNKLILNIPFFKRQQKIIANHLSYFNAFSEKRNLIIASNVLIYISFIVIAETILMLLLIKATILIKLMSLAVVYLLDFIFYKTLIKYKKNKLKEDFPLLLKQFICNYSINNNIRNAFALSLNDIGSNYNKHIQRLVNELNTNSDIKKPLKKLNDRVDYNMCNCFTAILLGSSKTNSDIPAHLINLEKFIAEDIVQKADNKERIASSKGSTIFLSIVLLATIFTVGNYFKVNGGNFFFNTSEGQGLFIFSIILVIWAWINIYLIDKT